MGPSTHITEYSNSYEFISSGTLQKGTLSKYETPRYGLTERTSPEAEFLDVIWTKVFRVFFLAVYSRLH